MPMTIQSGNKAIIVLTAMLFVCAIVVGMACDGEEPTPAPTEMASTPTPNPTPTAAPSSEYASPLPTARADYEEPTSPLTPTLAPEPEDVSALTNARADHQALLLDDGRVLVGGGLFLAPFGGDINDIDDACIEPSMGLAMWIAVHGLSLPTPNSALRIYDPADGSWTMLEPVDETILAVGMTGMENGNVLILAAQLPASTRNRQSVEDLFCPPDPASSAADLQSALARSTYTAFVLDVESGAMTKRSTSSVVGLEPEIVPLVDGRFLVGGTTLLAAEEGVTGIPLSTQFEIYDPVNDSWQPAAPPAGNVINALTAPEAIAFDHWLTTLGGKPALVIAGEGPDGYRAAVMVYDDSEDSWSTISDRKLSYERDLPMDMATTISGELVVFYRHWPIVHHPITGSHTLEYGPRDARPLGATSTALPDGRLLMSGGSSMENFLLPSRTTEIFDPVTGVLEPGPELGFARLGHTATLLQDGSVLIFGGFTNESEENWARRTVNDVEIIPASALAPGMKAPVSGQDEDDDET